MYNHSFDASFLGASSFKERKKIENRKVVDLGGKVISFSLCLGILAGIFFHYLSVYVIRNRPLRNTAHH